MDNLFNGFPGADTVQAGYDHDHSVLLQHIPLDTQQDLDHGHTAWSDDWDHGRMDGFNKKNYPSNYAYSYVSQSDTVPYWTPAKAYTFGDRMFASNAGPSFVAHQYMIAGQSGSASENPNGSSWGCDSAPDVRVKLVGPNGTDLLSGVFPCFDYQTIADLLGAKGCHTAVCRCATMPRSLQVRRRPALPTLISPIPQAISPPAHKLAKALCEPGVPRPARRAPPGRDKLI